MAEHHLPVENTLDNCIKCNICVVECPVAPITDLFPGPKYEAPQAGRFRSNTGESPDLSVDYCSGCRACNLACPTGVKIAEINARARARMVENGKFSWRIRLRNNIIARSEAIGKVGQPISPIANALLSNGLARQLIESTLAIHKNAPLPSFSKEKFSTWFKNHKRPGNLYRKVVYFHGCSTEYYEPRVGIAAVQVLEKNGFEVIIPPQNCCGLPLLSNGEFTAARKYQNGNVSSLFPFANEGIPIVGTSTSCTLTLKEEARELLDMNDAKTLKVARSTFDIHEFLLILLSEGSLQTDFKPVRMKIPYHPPCQYRGHRLGLPTLEILDLIPELQIIESTHTCCGIAGTYGYKSEKYEISRKVGEPLFNFLKANGEHLVLCDSETCRWQINHATGLHAIHPIQLLAFAYGYPGEFSPSDQPGSSFPDILI